MWWSAPITTPTATCVAARGSGRRPGKNVSTWPRGMKSLSLSLSRLYTTCCARLWPWLSAVRTRCRTCRLLLPLWSPRPGLPSFERRCTQTLHDQEGRECDRRRGEPCWQTVTMQSDERADQPRRNDHCTIDEQAVDPHSPCETFPGGA